MLDFVLNRSRPLAAAISLVMILAAGCAGEGGANSTPVAPLGRTATATQASAPAEEATAVATSTALPAAAASPATPAPAATEPATPASSTTAAAATETPAAAASPAGTETNLPQVVKSSDNPPDLSSLKLSLRTVASGFSDSLDVVDPRDGSGRLFVVEKTGTIRIVADGKPLATPFIDISDRIRSSGSEQGLLGLAFPPDYASRKFFFVNYTNRDGDTVISRFRVTDDPNVADPANESVVLTFDQPAPNHNGGDLVFGPDGYLWIGTGDGGGAGDQFGNGQNPATLLAKMLRVDVTSDPSKPYTIPPDNPAVAHKWDALPEAWAIGLRNPWRYSFDSATGDLWIGDVGQNRIEEVDVVRAGSQGGLNFGWPVMEGPDCYGQASCDQSGLVLPVASYPHGEDGCSITGGFVYRGKQFPSLQGVYLYGDYCSGRIWGLDAANPGQPVLLVEAGAGLSSFGEDQVGEIYITDINKGTVRQVTAQ